MERFVHALFPDRQAAAKAVDALVNANFSPREVGALVANDRMEVKELVVERKTIVRGGALIGIILGAPIGMLTLAAFGLIALTSPLEALQGAAVGGVVGLLAGTLGGLGYWKHVIDFPRDAFKTGTVLVGVATNRGRVQQAREALGMAGARRTYACSKNGAVQRAIAWANTEPRLGSISRH